MNKIPTANDILAMTAQYLRANSVGHSTQSSTTSPATSTISRPSNKQDEFHDQQYESTSTQKPEFSHIKKCVQKTNVKAHTVENSKKVFDKQTVNDLSKRITGQFPKPKDRYDTDNALQRLCLLKQVNDAPSDSNFFFERHENCNGEHKAAWKIEQSWNNFLKAVVLAFAYHLPLRLKPDHILYCVLSGFNVWTNEMGGHKMLAQKKLVDENKKDIVVDIPLDPDWDLAIDQLSSKLEQTFSDQNLVEVIKASFTTTTPTISRVKDLTVASIMKNFVNISFNTMCGIPYVTLEGTKDDWERLKVVCNSLLSLSDGQLNWWLDKLNSSLDVIIRTVDGNYDTQNEWTDFLKFKSESGSHGCNGWINNFFPFVYNYDQEIVKNVIITEEKTRNYGEQVVDFKHFLPSISQETYDWTVMGKPYKKIKITAGLLDVIQWTGEDFALEPFFGYQIDEVVTI